MGVLDAISIRYTGSERWVSIASHTLSHELARFISVSCAANIRKVDNLDSIKVWHIVASIFVLSLFGLFYYPGPGEDNIIHFSHLTYNPQMP